MAIIKYNGPSDFRELDPEAISRLGVDTQESLRWARDEALTVEDAVGAALVAQLPDEFTDVTAGQPVDQAATAAPTSSPSEVPSQTTSPVVDPAPTDAPADSSTPTSGA